MREEVEEEVLRKGSKVCVTGASGFIGSWVVKLLLERGYRVKAAVRNPEDASKVAHLLRMAKKLPHRASSKQATKKAPLSSPSSSSSSGDEEDDDLDDDDQHQQEQEQEQQEQEQQQQQRLELVKADLLDVKSLAGAVSGCAVVIHTACPCPEACVKVADPESQLIAPAVDGTVNVLRVSAAAGVSAVVFTSSVGAMYLNGDDRPCRVLDESCWSDEQLLRSSGEWYCLAKTLSEKRAWELVSSSSSKNNALQNNSQQQQQQQQQQNNPQQQHQQHQNSYNAAAATADEHRNGYNAAAAVGDAYITEEEQERLQRMRLVSLNPAVVLGPMLQAPLNASSTHILKYLLGSVRTYANRCQAYVDVRDVAAAAVLAAEDGSARGRYFLAAAALHRGDLVATLADLFPRHHYPLPATCSPDGRPRASPYAFSNARARQLGVRFTPLRRTLRDSVLCLQQRGYIPAAPSPLLPLP